MARSDEFINGFYRYSAPWDSDKQTEYVYGMGEGSSGLQSALRARLTHPQTEYTTNEDIAADDDYRADYRGPERVWHDPDTRQFSKKIFDDNGQGTLFGMDYTPPTIDYMAGTKDASRAGIGKVLGLAAQDSQLRWGTAPMPSSNLSEHSAPVVNELVKAGLIQGREKDEPFGTSNSYSWREGQEAAESIKDEIKGMSHRATFEEVPHDEARLAERNLIAAIRAGKKDPNAIPRQWRNVVQPTLPLPGLEK